jgi:hypothetical protein
LQNLPANRVAFDEGVEIALAILHVPANLDQRQVVALGACPHRERLRSNAKICGGFSAAAERFMGSDLSSHIHSFLKAI